MQLTAAESPDRTLARLVRAMDRQYPVTMTYTKADGTETIRTIEVYDVATTAAGDIVLKSMDRESGEKRTWRTDRITAYTVHRSTYTVPREETDQTPKGHSLAAAAAILAPTDGLPQPLVPPTADQRVNVLAGVLAAA
jgi:predicted DNA-binding transcriptional regulator YafY